MSVAAAEQRVSKGYFVHAGYMGWVGNRYMLFATDSDYREYWDEQSEVAG